MRTDDVEQPARAAPAGVQRGLHGPRVFATGVSNGGGFAARVGCELRRRRRDRPRRRRLPRARPLPSTAAHVGARDPRHAPTTSSPTAARSPTTPARSRATSPAGRSRDGCAGKPTSRRETKVVTHLRYPRCANGLAVEHLRLADVDHGWPEKGWGLDTNMAVLRFFASITSKPLALNPL